MSLTHRLSRPAAALLAAVVVACLAPPGAAVADPGALTYGGCLGNDAARGCADLPFAPLAEPRDVAVSPDGASVYVVSSRGDSIAHLFRAPDGALALDGCLSSTGDGGCGKLPGAALTGARAVAVSPDGRSVYVASYNRGSVTHFFRAPGGQITYDGCLNNDGSEGCGDLPSAPLLGASDVAVSPDGRSVYVASELADSVGHFARGGPDGQLTAFACHASTDERGCHDVPEAPLGGATSVAVSPDGRSVYVTAQAGDAIGHFFRESEDGALTWDGCLNGDGAQNCGDLPGAPLRAAAGVTVSADGRSVYVASRDAGSVSHLVRAAGGQIAWGGCLSSDGTQGTCFDVPGAALAGASAVAASADGRSVYVASPLSDSVAHLARDVEAGHIAWAGCFADTNARGCEAVAGAPLDQASSVAVSPDGRSVYAVSPGANTLAHFVRELPPAAPSGTPPEAPADESPVPAQPAGEPVADPPHGDDVAPVVSRLAASRRRARGATFRFELSEPATVTVAIDRRLPGRRSGRTCRRPSARLRRRAACVRFVPVAGTLTHAGAAGPSRLPFTGRLRGRVLRAGAYRARLTATDAAGNRSAPVAVGFRIAPR